MICAFIQVFGGGYNTYLFPVEKLVRELLFRDSEDVNFRSDITGTFDRKASALRCHESQMGRIARTLGTSDLESWLRPLCELSAEGEDFELAEAFHREEVMR